MGRYTQGACLAGFGAPGGRALPCDGGRGAVRANRRKAGVPKVQEAHPPLTWRVSARPAVAPYLVMEGEALSEPTAAKRVCRGCTGSHGGSPF